MIDSFLYADWDEPPEGMDFELPYGLALSRVGRLVEALRLCEAPGDAKAWAMAQELYLLAPAIINVLLNYRICVEFGLIVHPTEYIDFTRKPGCVVRYLPETKAQALELFQDGITLARGALRLAPGIPEAMDAFIARLPPALKDFLYTSKRDKYTWRASEPARVAALASAVRKGSAGQADAAGGRPALAVGAAHGAIMPGLLLAEYLDCPLWFVRFSMFKRKDAEPVLSSVDERVIAEAGQRGMVLAFDEDCASGLTLRTLVDRLSPLAPSLRSASIIRHATSSFSPDFSGKTWWD
ncbi:MAG TPA: hypothetical protein DCG47_00600 [Spirochaetaceae bacterium]|jgi:hypothetical protein|nr:hypothetical protein [Spirochaetaceae bacterium]